MLGLEFRGIKGILENTMETTIAFEGLGFRGYKQTKPNEGTYNPICNLLTSSPFNQL